MILDPVGDLGVDVWDDVRSSNLKGLGARGNWLVAQFRRGGEVYRYKDCATYLDQLLNAESVGTEFNKTILVITKGQKVTMEWPDDD